METNENKILDDIQSQDFEKHLQTITEALAMLEDENISLHKSLEIYKNGKEALMKAQKILDNAKLEFCELDKENE